MKGIIRFFREARAELRKVTWPTWNDVTRSTGVVFFTVLFFTVFVYFTDKGIARLVSWVLR